MNPHNAPWLNEDMKKTLETIKRLDTCGYLYSMDCKWDYYMPGVENYIGVFNLVRSGCAAFTTNTFSGGAITGRNYDYKHYAHNDKTTAVTGQNMIVRCTPKGKYKSIGVADTFWLDGIGTFYNGTLDDGKTDISPAVLLPYACMDGMNEKGFFVSILSQDIKKGETGVCQNEEGKPKIAHTVLMRYMLDTCADIEEAIAKAKSVNIVSHNGSDYRLFISDAEGKSAALEWRYNKLYVTYTNISTNFFVGFDDMENRVKDGVILEKPSVPVGLSRKYHVGYGGGYYRFNIIANQLEMCVDRKSSGYRTVMNEDRAEIIIRSVIQGIGSEVTSNTQYSAVYNQEKLTLTLTSMPKYKKKYKVKL